MKRVTLKPREGWQKRLEEAGCEYHTIDGVPYWAEDAAYEFTAAEVDAIEAATQELHSLCLEHCRRTVEEGDYRGYGFPDEVKQIVEEAWNRSSYEGDHLIGRMDLGFNPGQEPKLFEYNADTPTSLPEASVWQWHALEDRKWPDQFNSIHETLVERWKKALLYQDCFRAVHFTAHKDGRHEDWGNLHYMMEVATEAGAPKVSSLSVDQIGWPAHGGIYFTDLNEDRITSLFKLYPWEHMMADEFGWKVAQAKTKWIEPPWKMLLSTKALLPLLWKRNPRHPNLLESYFDKGEQPRGSAAWVRKPLLGREGANISIVGPDIQSEGSFHEPHYDKHGYIYQYFWPILSHDNVHVPVIGSWVVGNKACGMGIREEKSVITRNTSCFVPHYFVE